MTLYYFNPNNYGEQYFIMDHSKESALFSLKIYLKGQSEDQENDLASTYKDDYKMWEGASVDHLPDAYSIEEFSVGQVVETEIA